MSTRPTVGPNFMLLATQDFLSGRSCGRSERQPEVDWLDARVRELRAALDLCNRNDLPLVRDALANSKP